MYHVIHMIGKEINKAKSKLVLLVMLFTKPAIYSWSLFQLKFSIYILIVGLNDLCYYN